MADLPAQSRFCLRCGTPVPTEQSAAPVPAHSTSTPFAPVASPAFPRPANRGLKLALAAMILAIAVLSALIVHGGMLHAARNSENGSLVQAPGDAHSGPLVQSPGSSQAPPDLAQKPLEGPPNAADVEDYLRFLKDVERRKMALIKDFTTRALMQSATEKQQEVDAASSDDASKKFLPNINKGNEDFAPKWDELAKYFLTKTPPQSCREQQQKYYDHLGKIESMFAQLHNALEQASTDPGKALSALTGMQGTASAEADDSARSADDALADVCDKYRIRKDFDIKTDSGSSSGLLP